MVAMLEEKSVAWLRNKGEEGNAPSGQTPAVLLLLGRRLLVLHGRRVGLLGRVGLGRWWSSVALRRIAKRSRLSSAACNRWQPWKGQKQRKG